MRLSRELYSRLHTALVDLGEADVAIALRTTLDARLDDVAKPGAWRVRAAAVVEWAERQGRVPDLVRGVAGAAPHNDELQTLASEVGTRMLAGPPPTAAVRGTAAARNRWSLFGARAGAFRRELAVCAGLGALVAIGAGCLYAYNHSACPEGYVRRSGACAANFSLADYDASKGDTGGKPAAIRAYPRVILCLSRLGDDVHPGYIREGEGKGCMYAYGPADGPDPGHPPANPASIVEGPQDVRWAKVDAARAPPFDDAYPAGREGSPPRALFACRVMDTAGDGYVGKVLPPNTDSRNPGNWTCQVRLNESQQKFFGSFEVLLKD